MSCQQSQLDLLQDHDGPGRNAFLRRKKMSEKISPKQVKGGGQFEMYKLVKYSNIERYNEVKMKIKCENEK